MPCFRRYVAGTALAPGEGMTRNGALLLLSVAACSATAPHERPRSVRPADPVLDALRSSDDAVARPAMDALARRGEAAIPALRALTADADPRVAHRAKEVLGRITGQWGEGRIVWKRSVAAAVGGNRPLLVMHLFGHFDQEFC